MPCGWKATKFKVSRWNCKKCQKRLYKLKVAIYLFRLFLHRGRRNDTGEKTTNVEDISLLFQRKHTI